MKKRNFVATLLALIMVLALATTSASANTRPTANVPSLIPDLVLNVTVDGVLVKNVNVYQGTDGNFRVNSHEDLRKIFPELFWILSTELYDPPRDGIVIDDYIKLLGYTAEVSDTTLSIHTSGKKQIYDSYEIYLNNFYLGTSNTLNPSTIPTNVQVIYSGNRIYLNNDGNLPVEVTVNGKLVSFPDQQPVIVNPGRTLIPIRSVAELINCNVEWNTELKCAVISRDSTTLHIFPGKTGYLINGEYRDMDVSPIIINDRTMVPIRFIAEAFGFRVGFIPGTVGTVALS